jgi:2-oxoglutarate dehydrogenase E2 component (dihydrolipoamide succinyltransferase)
MRTEVKLPSLGEDSDAPKAAKVSFWFVDVGERIAEGDDLVAMFTDKATFDVPSPVTGTLVETKAAEADTVKVGEVIALVETVES